MSTKSQVRLPHPAKGTLKKYGYSTKLSADERHKSLNRAVGHNGYVPTVRLVNELAILNKNKPAGQVLERDKKYLMRTFK